MPSLSMSDFAKKNYTHNSGNSYTTLTEQDVIRITLDNIHHATPGNGEIDCSRKILVPVPNNSFYCPPHAKIALGLPIQAKVVQRQAGEDPYIQTFVKREDAIKFGVLVECPANSVHIVCYHKEALLENNGNRSSDSDWEIVAILCHSDPNVIEPMSPLTMARNQLEAAGGTKGTYSSEEYAQAILYHSTRKDIMVKD